MPLFARFMWIYMQLYGLLHIIAYNSIFLPADFILFRGNQAAFPGDLYGIICIYI